MALTVSSANPRYFQDAGGNLVYLVGWYDNFSPQSGGDWPATLSAISTYELNCVRLWVRHHVEKTPNTFTAAGGGTFDLTVPNPAYLAALRSACVDLNALGAYATVMFWQGWSLIDNGWGNGFLLCPFKSSLNINGINGDWYNADSYGLEVDEVYGHTATSLTGAGAAELAIRTVQRGYIRAVIDTLNDLDNIIWEVSNEDRFTNPNKIFQEWVANEIRTYEAGKAKQHPVGITATYNDTAEVNTWLRTTSADWIAVTKGEGYDTIPVVNTSGKVVLTDTDHIWGNLTTITYDWVWKTALRGNHPLLLAYGTRVQASAMAALKHTRQYLNRLTLAYATPSSTGYSLTRPGREYLCYQPTDGPFTQTMLEGHYVAEWFNPTTGNVIQTTTYTASTGNNTLTPPFSGPAVCLLTRREDTVAYATGTFAWNYAHSGGEYPAEYHLKYGAAPGVVSGQATTPYGNVVKSVSSVLPTDGLWFTKIYAYNTSYGEFANATELMVQALGAAISQGVLAMSLHP